MMERSAGYGAATLVVLALLGQVLSKEIWESASRLERASLRRAVLSDPSSFRNKESNKTMDVSTQALYPVLAQLSGCRHLLDGIVVPETSMLEMGAGMGAQMGEKFCMDDVCLVQAMLAKSRLIIIDHDIDVSGSLPLPDVNTRIEIIGRCTDHYPCKIDGMGAGRIFIVGIGGLLVLRNLEIRGGYCNEGAAVLITGTDCIQPSTSGKLLALNVFFFNNTASTGSGGAILARAGGAVHVRNSVFEQNEAAKGGAVYVGGSEDSDPDHPGCGCASCATFVNTAFTHNWASFGGAVYVDDATIDCAQNGGGKFECATCSFQENIATEYGGGLCLAWKTRGAAGQVKFSLFLNNTSKRSGSGGAVELERADHQWTRGVQFNSFYNEYSQSIDNATAVSVNAWGNATFTHNRFLTHNAVACENGTCNFCGDHMPEPLPSMAPMAMAPMVPAPPPMIMTNWMCPGVPAPLCEWQPPECFFPAALPAPAPAPIIPPPPPPPPPAIIKKKFPPPPGTIIQDAAPAPPPPPAMSPPHPCKCKCHPPKVYGDPHFYGKHGEHFDFHGRSGRDYCVVTDKELQINMHLFRGLQKPTTFIAMLGMLYAEDKILINAQAHANASGLSGQWTVRIHNVEMEKDNRYINPQSGLNITTTLRQVHILVPGTISMIVNIIPGTSGTRGSGANYLNFEIEYLSVSPAVHGLLGQTYQETMEAYKKLHEARTLGPARASSVLLDGTADDYLTTNILAPDCKYAMFEDGSTFMGKVHRTLVNSAHNFLPFSTHKKLAAEGCTGVGDQSVCENTENED